MKKLIFLALFTFFLLPFLQAEDITLTTYYPSPSGVYNELRAKRMAIGDNYYDPSSYTWGSNIDSSADLVVEGDVGIGTTNPSETLDVVGTIYASVDLASGGAKTFVIDHPVQPGKKLVHASVEGPEAAVFYRGQAKLTAGEAIVQLSDYFEALTREKGRTVLLTPIGGYSPLYLAEEVKDGEFKVKTTEEGNPKQKFYWEVKAVRADVELLQVEVEKGG